MSCEKLGAAAGRFAAAKMRILTAFNDILMRSIYEIRPSGDMNSAESEGDGVTAFSRFPFLGAWDARRRDFRLFRYQG